MTEESVKTEVDSLENVLKLMDRVNEGFSYEVWIPSLNKSVMFREINTNQQKRLIKSIIDSPIYNTEFIFTLRKIIKENCVDTTIDVDQLTIVDKLVIAMKMRSVSVGDKFEFNISSEDENVSEIKRAVSLEKLLKEFKKTVKMPKEKVFSDDKDIYTLKCGVPNILTEYKLESEFRSNYEEEEISDYNKLRQTIGNVFIGELSKYIKEVSIKNDDKITKINLDDLIFKDRIVIIEKLPESLIKDVVKYIEKIKEEVGKLTLIKIDIGTKDTPNIREERFAIDGNFFTGS